MISLYHICPSKVRAYNCKGELKILYVCSLTCRYMFWEVVGGEGGGGVSIRGWGVGIRGEQGEGSRYKGRGSREGEWV